MRLPRYIPCVIVACLLLGVVHLLYQNQCIADVLITTSGTRWEGKVVEKGDNYELTSPTGGTMVFPKSVVKQVIDDPSTEGPTAAAGDDKSNDAAVRSLEVLQKQALRASLELADLGLSLASEIKARDKELANEKAAKQDSMRTTNSFSQGILAHTALKHKNTAEKHEWPAPRKRVQVE